MTVRVSPDNFIRAESDQYFGNIVRGGGLGRFIHFRDFGSLDEQLVVRQNRDTLYSAAIFDLDAGPVTVTLPDAGTRFRSLQVITEDHYVPEVSYTAGSHTYDRAGIGTRYVMLILRTLVDPNDPADLAAVHALQDGVVVEQAAVGSFDIPEWDPASQGQVREALIALFATLPDSKGMFGPAGEVDPVRRLIGAAAAWGGNPEREALYLTVNPERNDGETVHRLTVGDVPADGFWSITVYNAEGYFTPNPADAYSVNSVTAKRGTDGSVTVQ
ncbi:carboxylesterase, partial [Mycobacterium sp. ITM-2017-0098]